MLISPLPGLILPLLSLVLSCVAALLAYLNAQSNQQRENGRRTVVPKHNWIIRKFKGIAEATGASVSRWASCTPPLAGSLRNPRLSGGAVLLTSGAMLRRAVGQRAEAGGGAQAAILNAKFGSWASPITAELLSQGRIGLGSVTATSKSILWCEGRPMEGGKVALMHMDVKTRAVSRLNPGGNCRTRVHEYGGAAYTVLNERGDVVCSEFGDQHLLHARPPSQGKAFAEPTASKGDATVSDASPTDANNRYADGHIDHAHSRVVMVRETHADNGQEPVNEVVSIPNPSSSGATTSPEDIVVLATGNDFYAYPRPSPDGKHLAYITWNHPSMPWDLTELHVVPVDAEGGTTSATTSGGTCVSSGGEESVCQPVWTPDSSQVVFISDRNNGHYNLMVYSVAEKCTRVLTRFDRDVTCNQGWGLGHQVFHIMDDNTVVMHFTGDEAGTSRLCTVDITTGAVHDHAISGLPPYILSMAVAPAMPSPANPDRPKLEEAKLCMTMIAGGPKESPSLYQVDWDQGCATLVKESFPNNPIDAAWMPSPTKIDYKTDDDAMAHAFLYSPSNPNYEPPEGDLPPCLVKIHGGPTSCTSPVFRLDIAFWTSRGVAVLDVDYRGSQGYGRAYRDSLKGNWGVADVADCCNGAKHVADMGLVNPKQLCIDGGSAGGFTTLACLAFKDVFAAGCSLYGISDLEMLAGDTHKFESRYLDSLVGPYPEAKALYQERSPISSVDTFRAPILLLQGDEDKVCPPNQSEAIFKAVKAAGVPCAYLVFKGEQHGFRKDVNIQRALLAELEFYGRVFEFEPADEIEPLQIENM